MSGLLNIAAGLVGVYVILALITAHFAEAVSALVNKRGKALFEGLGELFGDAKALPGAASLVGELYAKPLINGPNEKRRKPAYIATRTLTISLIQILQAKAGALPPLPVVAPVVQQGQPPLAATQNPGSPAFDLLADLQKDLRRLEAQPDPVGTVAASLSASLQTARADYQSGLKAIDDWFQSQMDRISGGYTRWSSVVQLLIAAVLVAFLNADSFAIVDQLSRSATVATALSSANPDAEQTVSAQLKSLSDGGLQLGWNFATSKLRDQIDLRKVGGLLTTWAAVLLGAPFWFNLLKQFVPVRLAGAKPGGDGKT